MNPDPKHIALRLTGKAKKALKQKAYDRAMGSCESCGKWVPIVYDDGSFSVFDCAHLSHIRGYGAGGGDTIDNVKIECYKCHFGDKGHGPRWGKP